MSDIDTADFRAEWRLPYAEGEAIHALCDAVDRARDRNAELMNDRTEALNGEALQRGRAHAAESRIANALRLIGFTEPSDDIDAIRLALTEPTP